MAAPPWVAKRLEPQKCWELAQCLQATQKAWGEGLWAPGLELALEPLLEESCHCWWKMELRPSCLWWAAWLHGWEVPVGLASGAALVVAGGGLPRRWREDLELDARERAWSWWELTGFCCQDSA